MKYIQLLTIFLLFSTASQAENINLSGHWDGQWSYIDNPYIEKISFDLKQHGNNISGTGIDEQGIKAIVQGHIKNKSIEIVVTPENGQEPIKFVGKYADSRVEGTWHITNLSGTWFMSVITHNPAFKRDSPRSGRAP